MDSQSPLTSCPRGRIAEMLAEAYATLVAELPAAKVEDLVADWRRYDAAIHDEPESVGAAGFATRWESEVIGFASWDPREWPRAGNIGHHCILPRYQGQGHGRRQLERILQFFCDSGFEHARVRTDEHPFFSPARRIYEACGFREVRREPGTLLEEYASIVYELSLMMRS